MSKMRGFFPSSFSEFKERIELHPDPSSFVPDNGYSNRDLDPVPISRRTWAWYNISGFWLSEGFSIVGFEVASSMVAQGLNPGIAIAACLIGNLLVMVPCALNGYAGAVTGVNFPVLNRSAFGVRGAKLTVAMRGLVACIWYGVQSYIGGQSVYEMLRAIWPSIENMKNTLPASAHTTSVDLLCFFLFWLISLPFLYISPSSMRWLLLVKCIIMPIAGLALFIWSLVMAKGLGPLLTKPTKMIDGQSAATVFFTGITGAIGPSATFALNMPDFCRYTKRPRDAFWGSVWGLPVMLTLIAFLGAVVTSASQTIFGVEQWNPVLVVGLFENRAARFFVALIFAFATLGTNICANSIAFGNDSAFLFPKYINIRRGSFICGLLGFAITPWNIENSAGSFLAFLNAYSVFLGPIAGLMVADFYIVRRQRVYLPEYYKVGGLYWYWKGINWRGIAALVLSIIPNMPGMVNSVTPTYNVPQGAKDLYTMSWFVGFVTAGFLLWLFHTLFPVPLDLPEGATLEGAEPADPGYDEDLYYKAREKGGANARIRATDLSE